MRSRIGLKRSASKKALLAVAGLAALVVPVTNGGVKPAATKRLGCAYGIGVIVTGESVPLN